MLKKNSSSVASAAFFATLLTVSPLAVAAEQDAYIPADTVFYVGTGKPIPVDDIFALMPDFASIRGESDPSRSDRMVELLEDPAAALAAWGIEDEISFSAYSVGLSPVLRISLSDPEKFRQALEALEAERDLKGELREKDGWTIKLYSAAQVLDDDQGARDQGSRDQGSSDQGSSNESSGASEAKETDEETSAAAEDGQAMPKLVVGIGNEDVVIGFAGAADNAESIDTLLGIIKPENSMAGSDKLKNFRKQWGYGEELSSYVDFTQIAAVLTDAANPVARQLQDSGVLNPRMQATLDQMRTEPCKSEMTQLVANWPMVVGGYRNFEVTDKQVDFDTHAAVVIDHEQLKETLKLFRGMLPSSQSSSEPMLSLGLGLTVDNLAQALGQLNEMAASVRYRCQILSPLNSIAATDLGAVSMGVVMFGGMARGVRGLSINLFDADIDPDRGASGLKSIDSAITIAADDPALLIGTLKMLPQFGALANLPADGSEIDVTSAFPLPLPADVRIKAAMKGNNIVLFSGEKSTDFANRLAQNQTEGFFLGKLNTRLVLEKLSPYLGELGEADEREQIAVMLDQYLQGELSYSLEFTDNGAEVVSKGLVDRRDSKAASE